MARIRQGVAMQIWIDILLTDSWAAALAEVAHATSARYPEIPITALEVMGKLCIPRPQRRFWCRHMARRTRLDPDGIDVCWLMLAADTDNPAVTYGFVDRLGDRFVEWQRSDEKVVPDWMLLDHLDRWSQIRDGVRPASDD